MQVNLHTITGRLGQDAERKDLKEDRALLSFSLAADRVGKKADDEDPSWFAVKYFTTRKGADYLADRLTTGALVFVSGEHLIEGYTDKAGAKRKFAYIKANTLEVLRTKTATTSQEENPGDHANEGGINPETDGRFNPLDW